VSSRLLLCFVLSIVLLVPASTWAAPAPPTPVPHGPPVHKVKQLHTDKKLTARAKHVVSRASDPDELICGFDETGEVDELVDSVTGEVLTAFLFFFGQTFCQSFPDGTLLGANMSLYGPSGLLTFGSNFCPSAYCAAWAATSTAEKGEFAAIYSTQFIAPPGEIWLGTPPGCEPTGDVSFTCALAITFSIV
jgi:hypothetical protein